MNNIELENLTQREAYWNKFYSHRHTGLEVPSQFAVFVLGEISSGGALFDIGCGTGRDALYFASRGVRVIGVDGSAAAVQSCTQLAEHNGITNASFLAAPIDQPSLAEALNKQRPDAAVADKVTVYARFFLHAIKDEEETAFLKLAASLCAGGGKLAVEFRTVRDADQSKVTGAHYRRFINPLNLIARAGEHGFSCDYFVEGFGYAKYKDDDAHVARCLFTAKI